MQWCEKEEEYLRQLHDNCVLLSKIYNSLYLRTHSKQTKLRIPTIVMSSCTGVASFGSTSFPLKFQKYVSIVVGIINVGIAMIQTYESYLKIGDIVSKSLAVSTSFKKLADDIYCELFIPVEDRANSGIMFLRDCFTRYQTILEQCPPLHDDSIDDEGKTKNLVQRISREIKRVDTRVPPGTVLFGRTPFNAPPSDPPSSPLWRLRRVPTTVFSVPPLPTISERARTLLPIKEKGSEHEPVTDTASEYSDVRDDPDQDLPSSSTTKNS